MSGELRIKEALNMSGYTENEIASVARNLALTLRTVVQVVRQYEDWFVDCPEDSWRLQRDLMKALDIEPEPDELWEQDENGHFVVDPDRRIDQSKAERA